MWLCYTFIVSSLFECVTGEQKVLSSSNVVRFMVTLVLVSWYVFCSLSSHCSYLYLLCKDVWFWICDDVINVMQMYQCGPNWKLAVSLHRRKYFRSLIITCDWVRMH